MQIYVLLFLLLSGCSSTKIENIDSDDFQLLEKQFESISWKKEPAKIPKKTITSEDLYSQKYVCIDKQGKGSDRRTIEYIPKRKGMNFCLVKYKKTGKKNITYKAKTKLEKCPKIFEKISKYLRKRNYKCDLEKRNEAKIVKPMSKTPPTITCRSKKSRDIQKIEYIEMPNGSCLVEHTVLGKKKNVAEGLPNSDRCMKAYKQIPKKLKASGFTCK